MEERETIVIDVKIDDNQVAERLGKVTEEIEDLQKANSDLRKDVKAGNKEWKDVAVQMADNEAKIKTLKAEQSALKGQVAESTKANRVYGDSLKEQSARLNDLRNRYQSLNETQRNSEGGKAMLAQIQELDAKLKGTDASMGLFQRNVGDYANQVAKISGLFGSAGGAASSFAGKLGIVGQGMGALAATPLLFTLTALVSIVQKIKDAMSGSEEQTMKWKETMAAFEPITLAMKNGLTALAGILVDIVGVAVKGVTSALNGLAKAADWVGKIFHADWGLSEKTAQLKAQASATIELTKAENAYTLEKRANAVESAKIDRDVAELRAKAADKESYTAAQRKQYLQQAIDLERKKAAEEKRLAEENMRLLEARAAQAANSADDEDQLVQARVAVINADKNLAQVERSLGQEMQNLNKEVAQDGVAAWNAYAAKVKEAREQLKGLMQELPTIDEVKKKNSELASSVTNIIDPLIKADEGLKMMEREMAAMPDLFAPFKDDVDFMDVFALKFTENAKTIEGTSSALESSFSSLSSMYQQMAQDESKSEAEREAAAKKAKAWSAVQIAANSGVAVAKGVVASMDEPFPANIVALASTMAALLSAIAQAKQLASSFETGGVIGGYKGASMGKDDTFASVRTGEMVLNANQQRQLFEIANGSGTGGIAAAFAEAIRNMPAPVLDYKEFTAFESRVATISETSKLK